jgi:hypothetical protein
MVQAEAFDHMIHRPFHQVAAEIRQVMQRSSISALECWHLASSSAASNYGPE